MENAIEAIQAGAWDYLFKPPRVEDIEATVRRVPEVFDPKDTQASD